MNDLDCDDADWTIHPGAMETWYDGIDQDCDGANDFDQDGDGFVPLEHAQYAGALMPGDCWDDPQHRLLAGLIEAAQVHPGAPERCDEVDWDCDGSSIPNHAEAAYFDRAPDQTRVYIAPATAIGLPQEAEGVIVCGTNDIEPVYLSTDSPDFELVGLHEATVCPTPHEPVLTALGSTADLSLIHI